MRDVSLKVSYLKGLVDGLDIEDAKTKRAITEIINVMSDIAEAVDDLEVMMEDTQEYIESIDEDLGELESEVYGDDEDYDDYEDDEDYEFDDEGFIEVDCPNCHEVVYIDKDFIEDNKAECPNCNAVIDIEQ